MHLKFKEKTELTCTFTQFAGKEALSMSSLKVRELNQQYLSIQFL